MHFFYKLVPPRASFAQDMTADEAAVMGQHVVYWKGLIDGGLKVFALGPVGDPKGVFGIAVIEVETEAAAHELGHNDLAIKRTQYGFRYELHSMPARGYALLVVIPAKAGIQLSVVQSPVPRGTPWEKCHVNQQFLVSSGLANAEKDSLPSSASKKAIALFAASRT